MENQRTPCVKVSIIKEGQGSFPRPGLTLGNCAKKQRALILRVRAVSRKASLEAPGVCVGKEKVLYKLPGDSTPDLT